MQFDPPLLRGRLKSRYKRFLADIALADGTEITASCPNTGSMLGLTDPGAVVWVSVNDSPTRKYKHTLEIVEADLGQGAVLVGINTGRPNALVSAAIADGRLPELAGYPKLRREVRYGTSSRVDLLLEGGDGKPCYVEIKNVHLMRRPGLAEFPDSVTERGARHLDELAGMVAAGNRAVMLFLIQRGDAERMAVCRDIDPAYGAAFDRAVKAGVEAIAYRCRLTPEGIALETRVPIAV
jgi:sugar fermentation stimulation protein A